MISKEDPQKEHESRLGNTPKKFKYLSITISNSILGFIPSLILFNVDILNLEN